MGYGGWIEGAGRSVVPLWTAIKGLLIKSTTPRYIGILLLARESVMKQ
jgi:hypothetical protein